MKIAVILARFPSGIQTVESGEDIAAIKKSFKEIKVARVLIDGEEFADMAVYLDTGGGRKRKKLLSPTTVEDRARFAAEFQAMCRRIDAEKEAKRANAEGAAKASQVAQRVVQVIKEEVTAAAAGEAGEDGPESPSVTTAPAAPVAEPVNPPAETPAPAARESADEDDNHFGTPKKPRKSRT